MGTAKTATSRTVTLDYPIEYINGKGEAVVLKVIEIHRIKAKHLKGLPPGMDLSAASNSEILDILARNTGLCSEAIDELDFIDMEKVFEALGSFLEKSQTVGAKSSG